MSLLFEWDPPKARTNVEKHGVTFDEASTAFEDPLSVTVPDPLHSEEEERLVVGTGPGLDGPPAGRGRVAGGIGSSIFPYSWATVSPITSSLT